MTNEPQLRVQGRIDDEHFQPSLMLNLDQQPIDPIEPIIWDGQSFEFVIALEPGFQTLAVSTVDIPGNQSETIEITIELDEQPPVIILEQPNPDAATVAAERRFQVRGSLQDNGRPVRNPSIEIQVESSAGLVEYPPVRGNITGEFSQFVELGNGDNTVTVCGQDEAGNESCASGVVTKNAPCVNVESPIDGAFIGSDRIVIEGSVCEGVVQLRGAIGNGAPVDGALLNGLRFRLELPSQGEGEQEVLVTASNVDGDAATATVRVTVDSSSPTVTFRTPEANQCVGSEFTVIGTATDLESGVALVTVNGERVDNVGLDNMGGEFRQDITVRAGERDGQEVLVVATNRAGLTAETSTFVQVDTVAPQVTFDILNVNTPINPWLRPDGTGRVNFTGTVEVGQCGIAQGGFSVPGLVPSLDNEGRFTLRGVFEDGQHNLAWRIEDIVGNVREGNYGFRVDSTPPSVEFTSPVNDAFQQADSVRLAGTVTDVGSGVQQITVNGLSINFSAAANGATFDTQLTDLIEGPNVFRVVIRDDVGNETVETFTVNRDSSPPEIAITEPNIGVAVPLPLTVTGTYSDDRTQPDNQVITGIGLETITVNGVVASIDEETGTWTAYGVVVDPEDPILTVSARDRIGNESLELERSVRVQDYGYQAPSVDGIDLAVDPTYVDVADLNQDGRVDIIAVTASEMERQPHLFRGQTVALRAMTMARLFCQRRPMALSLWAMSTPMGVRTSWSLIASAPSCSSATGMDSLSHRQSHSPLWVVVFAVSSVTELAMVDSTSFYPMGMWLVTILAMAIQSLAWPMIYPNSGLAYLAATLV